MLVIFAHSYPKDTQYLSDIKELIAVLAKVMELSESRDRSEREAELCQLKLLWLNRSWKNVTEEAGR